MQNQKTVPNLRQTAIEVSLSFSSSSVSSSHCMLDQKTDQIFAKM